MGEAIELRRLPERLFPERESIVVPTGLTLRGIEKQAIEQALLRNQWKKTVPAREPGIDTNTLQRKIMTLGISTPG